MATDQNSLSAQADAVSRVVRHQQGKGRKVPQLEAAEYTLRALERLARQVQVHADDEDGDCEKFTDDFAQQVLTILRLPVVKA